MALDPLEKQHHLPALLVDLSNGYGRDRKIVGQKHQALVSLFFNLTDPAQLVRVAFF